MSKMIKDSEANQDHFVGRVREAEKVWGLKSAKGWAVCESNEYEDVVVYPFWSDAEYAQLHCTGEWSQYAPTPIVLDLFLDTWLPGMDEDSALVGPNWDQELSGEEMEPGELARLLGDGN